MRTSPGRKPARFLVGLLITVFLASLGAWLLVRHVLAPGKVRPVIEARLSSALGRPVRLGDVTVRFLPIPALEVKRVTIGEANRSGPSLEVDSLQIVPSFRALLGGAFAIDRVDLEGLDLVLRRDRKGQWQMPYAPSGRASSGGAERRSEALVPVRHIRIHHGRFRLLDDLPGPLHEAASLRDIEGNLALDQAGFRVEALTARMRRTELSGSALIAPDRTTLKLATPGIASEDLPQILALAGVAPIQGLSISGKVPFRLEMVIPPNGPCTASGEFDAAILRLGTLELTDLKTPFRIANGMATLAPLTFSAYGGRERGTATLAFARTPMGYTIRTDLDGVDVNRALSANTDAKNVLLGNGRVSAALEGAGFDAGALVSGLRGTASVALKDGVVRNLPLLARINQVLKLTGGDSKDTRFESLDGSFILGDGKAHTEDLKLQADELTLAAKGDIRFDLTLDFKGSARFSRTRTAALVRVLGEARLLVNDGGELELPFTVTGPVASPSVGVNLSAAAGRAVKQELKRQIGRQLQKLFQK